MPPSPELPPVAAAEIIMRQLYAAGYVLVRRESVEDSSTILPISESVRISSDVARELANWVLVEDAAAWFELTGEWEQDSPDQQLSHSVMPESFPLLASSQQVVGEEQVSHHVIYLKFYPPDALTTDPILRGGSLVWGNPPS